MSSSRNRSNAAHIIPECAASLQTPDWRQALADAFTDLPSLLAHLELDPALLDGAASALQFFLQTLGFDLPYQLFLTLPYLLTLAALAGWVGRSRAPAALAQPWPRGTPGA